MTNEYPSNLTSFTPEPELRAPKAQKRRPSIDPAQLIAEGIASDWRLGVPGNWSPSHFVRARPVGPPEFEALFYRIAPLPGVPRPKQYGVMCCELNAAAGTLERWLYGIDKRAWSHLTEKYYSGRSAYFTPDWRHRGMRPPCSIYNDTLRDRPPLAGAI